MSNIPEEENVSRAFRGKSSQKCHLDSGTHCTEQELVNCEGGLANTNKVTARLSLSARRLVDYGDGGYDQAVIAQNFKETLPKHSPRTLRVQDHAFISLEGEVSDSALLEKISVK